MRTLLQWNNVAYRDWGAAQNIALRYSLFSQLEKTPTEIKASGGWQRCADENVAQKCDAHLVVTNASALLNKSFMYS